MTGAHQCLLNVLKAEDSPLSLMRLLSGLRRELALAWDLRILEKVYPSQWLQLEKLM